ncbi:MAG: hypothetical protein S4CHLAM37_07830 [Chlamydiia bacterium]|nr:hypothetical protein [Chlamydiia bacterium]
MTEFISSVENVSLDVQSELQSFSSDHLLKTLPPWAQMEKEVQKIKENEDVQNALDGDEILEITKDDHDSIYYIKTENAVIRAYINYLPQDMCGPAKFEVNFLDKQEIKS